MLEGSLKQLTPPTTPRMHEPPLLTPQSPRCSLTEVPLACQIPKEYGIKLPSVEHMTFEVKDLGKQVDVELSDGVSSPRRIESSRISAVKKKIERVISISHEDEESEDQSSYRSSQASQAGMHAAQSELTMHHLDRKIDCLIEIMLENLKFTKAVHMTTKKSLTGPGRECAPTVRRSDIPKFGVRFNSIEHHSNGMPSMGVAAMAPALLRMATPRIGLNHERRHTLGRSLQEDDGDKQTRDMLELSRIIVKKTHSDEQLIGVGWLWRFLEDRSSSKCALAYSYGNDVFLMFSVLLAVFEIIELTKGNYTHSLLTPAQLIIELLFGIEVFIRFMVCPHKIAFWANIINIVDVTTAIPCSMRLVSLVLKTQGEYEFSKSVEFASVLCLVPVLRLMKLLRRFETFHLLLTAFRDAVEALPVILFTLVLFALSFSAIIFYCEPRSNVPTFLDCLWFVMVTMCGVAHGNPAPVSNSGKFWTVVTMLAGILYMAIPIGIVGTAFSEIWEDRHRLMLLMRMRKCVERSGYTPKELKEMFKLLDKDGDGSLDYKEFAAMIDVMNIGVEERFVMEVFESFDADGEGSIDFRELLRGLFPRTHWLIGSAEKADDKDEIVMEGVCSIEELVGPSNNW